jgi:hypothetical protein
VTLAAKQLNISHTFKVQRNHKGITAGHIHSGTPRRDLDHSQLESPNGEKNEPSPALDRSVATKLKLWPKEAAGAPELPITLLLGIGDDGAEWDPTATRDRLGHIPNVLHVLNY